MSKPVAALFVMRDESHFRRILPLVSGLAGQGFAPHVFTNPEFQARIERDGGTFVDLFGKYPLEAADDESLPPNCRFVSFAGHYADRIVKDAKKLDPSVVVYDTVAVIGRVVGVALGVPYVNACAGHNRDLQQFVQSVYAERTVNISPRCLRAVETLRDRYGIEDASPFSYAAGLSPFLNLYCEPAAFLPESERARIEPMAFYSSLPPVEEIEAETLSAPESQFGNDSSALRVYASFGTVAWRYWPEEVLAALKSISRFLGDREHVRGLISLGRAELDAESVRALEQPNVSVASYVDQWHVLQEADVFITHNGLNSTHEAIYHGVPMISYPFWADQPLLAKTCQSFGLAIPLNESPQSPVTREDLVTAFAELAERRESMQARLAEAGEWERQALAARDAVHERIASLASGAAPGA